jgi:hypothetical protein
MRAWFTLVSPQVANMIVHDPTDPDGLVARVDYPDNYCEAWPLLRSEAWQKIIVDNGVVTPRVLHCVGQAPQITRLQLHCHSDSSATHSDLAAALAPLRLLRSLDVQWHAPMHWDQLSMGSACAVASAMARYMKAVAGMTSLARLCLRNLPLHRSAADDIAGLQQSTWLDLSCCQLDDYAVNVIALRLAGG